MGRVTTELGKKSKRAKRPVAKVGQAVAFLDTGVLLCDQVTAFCRSGDRDVRGLVAKTRRCFVQALACLNAGPPKVSGAPGQGKIEG